MGVGSLAPLLFRVIKLRFLTFSSVQGFRKGFKGFPKCFWVSSTFSKNFYRDTRLKFLFRNHRGFSHPAASEVEKKQKTSLDLDPPKGAVWRFFNVQKPAINTPWVLGNTHQFTNLPLQPFDLDKDFSSNPSQTLNGFHNLRSTITIGTPCPFPK